MKPKRILDLFCGAGGAAMGLHQAWPEAEIVGVDIKPQPRYPFKFVQADALTYPVDGFDFIWASPPCQAHSVASIVHKNRGKIYLDLIPATRQKIEALSIPWVIENVVGAPLHNFATLCGLMFGLKVFRHRRFESSFAIAPPHPCDHKGKRIGEGFFSVAGGAGRWKSWGTVHRNISKGTADQWRDAMGISWMTRKEIAQAIPPAYSKWIALQYENSTQSKRDSASSTDRIPGERPCCPAPLPTHHQTGQAVPWNRKE